MRSRLLLSLVAFALVGAACSSDPETVVVGAGEPGTTIPGERPVEGSMESNNGGSAAAVEEDDPARSSPNDPTTTAIPEVVPEPDPIQGGDETFASWRERPLASVVLTGDDLAALGLGADWDVDWTDFIDIDDPWESEETICGTVVPSQTSYFASSFEARSVGMELELNVMPATGVGAAASDFITTLDALATCPDLEEQFAAVDIEIVAIDVVGADRSIVVTGIDATSPSEPIGLTLAAADVDGHLFMAIVAQDKGTPEATDIALAVAAVELSISRI
jgi:hypothetical protein